MKKTNAMRELDRYKIKYEGLEYEIDGEFQGSIHVAAQTGRDITKVFKTLALVNEKNELVIACIPGSDEIDLKKLAILAGSKRVEMLEMKYLQERTGYIRGGCTPIGIKKRHRTFIHNSALLKDEIYISGGLKGTQIKIAPRDLIDFLKIEVGDIVV